MLLHLYSAHKDPNQAPKHVKLDDEERPRANGHARVPNAADRQAADAQEFELDGLMSDDDDEPKMNGKPRSA